MQESKTWQRYRPALHLPHSQAFEILRFVDINLNIIDVVGKQGANLWYVQSSLLVFVIFSLGQ